VAAAAAAQTVTSPSTTDAVAPAADYATLAFQDPWDMDQRTDLGWWLQGVDSPASGLSSFSFSGGVFSATTATDDPLLFLLDTPVPGTVSNGKNGANFPIDADTYTLLAFRMRVDTNSAAQLFWSTSSMYDDVTLAYNIPVKSGWRVYVQRIPDLTRLEIDPPISTWSGSKRMLRFDPTVAAAGETMEIDWIRLVEEDAALWRAITWTGGGSSDIWLDDDADPGNGTLGKIAAGVSGGSYDFYVGALPEGDYWVHMGPAGGVPTSTSPGHYQVDGIPTLAFTAPAEEGSSDEFAAAQLGNAWDMDGTADLDYWANITGLTATTVAAEDEAGNSLGSIPVVTGTSVGVPSGVGDPYVSPLRWDGRGATDRIDPDHYRILTLELGLPVARDLAAGSIARIVWRVAGEDPENVSEDLIVNSKSGGAPVIARIVEDMKTLPLESDPGGSPSTTGWDKGGSGIGIEGFRVDPHEFQAATGLFVHSVKLAAFERMSSSYLLQWDSTPSGSAATLDLYHDSDRAGFDGTLIASGLDPTDGSYLWVPAGLTDGSSYYVYAVLKRGVSTLNRVYARWPIVKDPGIAPTVSAIAPDYGSSAGGTSVTVTGTGFVAGASLAIGGSAATGVNVASSTTLTATTGAGAAGPADVTVTNPDTLFGTLAAGYAYVDPCTATADLVLTGQTVTDPSQLFTGCTSVTAGPSFTVAAGAGATFRAGSHIVLRNGFAVEAGAGFTAELDPMLLVQ